MKYVSSLLFLIILLGGCAGNGDRNQWDYEGKGLVVLMDTEQYLPVQELDETGQLLPYEAKPNPYTQISSRVDKTAVTNYIEARRAFNAQNYDAAEKLLAKITEEEAKLSGPWVMRGDIAAQRGKLNQAIEYYAKAIAVNDINFNAWLRLAKVQRESGYFRHAQNTYARALALWPDAPEVHLNLGVLYDVYLNAPLKAQSHMEAYQLLHREENPEAVAWLDEVRSRTGIASALKVLNAEGELQMFSGNKQNETSAPESVTAKLVVTDGREE